MALLTSRSCSPSERHAFTLIELLVVVGVMAVLAALLMGAVAKAQTHARRAACRNNLSQVFKALGIYANRSNEMFPDLYAGLYPVDQANAADKKQHNDRYLYNHYCRSKDKDDNEVAAGLWLLVAIDVCPDPNVLYCPDTPGRRRANGSENPSVDALLPNGLTAKVPREVGYGYNCFPDAVKENKDKFLTPVRLKAEDASTDRSSPRDLSYYSLLSDVFLNDYVMTHGASHGLNCCYWDGSVQWARTGAREIPWNDPNGVYEGIPVRTFTEDDAGYTAVRDTWMFLSEERD